MGSPKLWLSVAAGAVALREVCVAIALSGQQNDVLRQARESAAEFPSLWVLAGASVVLAAVAGWLGRKR